MRINRRDGGQKNMPMPHGRSWTSECAWSLKSKKDPRFNVSGTGIWGYFIMGNSLPEEVENTVKKREKKYGVKRPDDLEISACVI